MAIRWYGLAKTLAAFDAAYVAVEAHVRLAAAAASMREGGRSQQQRLSLNVAALCRLVQLTTASLSSTKHEVDHLGRTNLHDFTLHLNHAHRAVSRTTLASLCLR
jgi:hypothetical protein